jgi:D-3-phosphoglycerate dehydrogenase
MTNILVTSTSFMTGCGKAVKLLKGKGYAIKTNHTGKPLEGEVLSEALSGCAGVIAGLDKITAETIKSAPGLKVISRFGVGVDNVDLNAATSSGIVVTTTPGANTEAVADLAFALMLATARNIVTADKATRLGLWPKVFGSSVFGKCVGIIGTGAIGRAFARRLTGFSTEILLYDINRDEEFAKSIGGKYVPFEELMSRADYISVHVPLNRFTKGMIGSAQLSLMKPTAHLINTARGGIVDEAALIDALTSGVIAGAGLDVYVAEPPKGSKLLECEKVVLSPHMGSYTAESLEAMGMMAAMNLVDVLEGKKPVNVANPGVYRK